MEDVIVSLFKREPAGETMELRVTGMSCGHCEMRVANALKGVEGVKDANADHGKGSANVVVEGDVPMDALVAAVEQAGYQAEPQG
jgi:copper chaperone CopZ